MNQNKKKPAALGNTGRHSKNGEEKGETKQSKNGWRTDNDRKYKVKHEA